MFDLGGTKLVVIILAALVILGPEELPGMLRRVGRLYGELKRLTDAVQSEVRGVLDEPTREFRETADQARHSLSDLTGSVRSALSPEPPDAGREDSEPAPPARVPDPSFPWDPPVAVAAAAPDPDRAAGAWAPPATALRSLPPPPST